MVDPSTLTQIFPPVVVAAVIVFWILLRYHKPLRSLLGDLQCLHSWGQTKWEVSRVNRKMRRSCERCKEQPLFRAVEGEAVLLVFEVDRKSNGALELRGKNRAVAIIPNLNVDNVVQYARQHIQQHVMPLFFIEDIERLRKSIELVYLKLLFDNLELDGAYSVAIHKILKEEFRQPHIERLFNAFTRVNEELKPKPWVDRRILRLILLETCRMELRLECR